MSVSNEMLKYLLLFQSENKVKTTNVTLAYATI